MKARSARLTGFGRHPAFLCIEEESLSGPGVGEVVVTMLASPVHPADLNVIEGKYGTLPILPATLGNEGCGRIAAIGSGVASVKVGDYVVVLTPGNWCSARVVGAEDVVRVPSGIDPLQSAMLVINPLTAWAMLHTLGKPAPGEWIAQNAANSAVGQCVIQIARELGLHTLNLVRRPDVAAELRQNGGDVVCSDEADFAAQAAARQCGCRLGFNAVGGAAALAVANTLVDDGHLVTYGAMARQPLKIPNGFLIFRGLTFRGFWLRRWLAHTDASDLEAAVRQLAEWMLNGQLAIPVEKTFSLGHIHEAVALAAQPGRSGKVILDLTRA